MVTVICNCLPPKREITKFCLPKRLIYKSVCEVLASVRVSFCCYLPVASSLLAGQLARSRSFAVKEVIWSRRVIHEDYES